jgi:putative transcriptional regulator
MKFTQLSWNTPAFVMKRPLVFFVIVYYFYSMKSYRDKGWLVLAILVIALAPIVAAALFPSAPAHAGLSPVRVPAGSALTEPDPFDASLPAKGKFLVASHRLVDPRFRETVVLLIGYGAEGVTGIIINQPTEVRLADMLPSMQGLKDRADVVYYGGPLEGHRLLMLIRSVKKPDESDLVFGDVYASASKKTLETMLIARKTAKQFRVYAGYAGWMPGQLDREMSRGDWLIVTADARTIFEKKPSEMWPELMRRGSEIQVRDHGNPDFAER